MFEWFLSRGNEFGGYRVMNVIFGLASGNFEEGRSTATQPGRKKQHSTIAAMEGGDA